MIIILLNSLIALMNSTFSRMEPFAAEQQLLLLARLLNDLEKRRPIWSYLHAKNESRAPAQWLHVLVRTVEPPHGAPAHPTEQEPMDPQSQPLAQSQQAQLQELSERVQRSLKMLEQTARASPAVERAEGSSSSHEQREAPPPPHPPTGGVQLNRHLPPKGTSPVASRVQGAGEATPPDLGALAVDVGTGEIKLVAMFYHAVDGSVELFQCASCKMTTISAVAEYSNNNRKPLQQILSSVIDEGVRNLEQELASRHRPMASFEWVDAVVGATAWYRRMHTAMRTASQEFLKQVLRHLQRTLASNDLSVRSLEIMILSEEKEAGYEQRAVSYAMLRSEPRLPTPDLIIGGGSGSVQVSGMGQFASFETPMADGRKCIAENLDGLDQWADAVGRSMAASTSLQGLIAAIKEKLKAGDPIKAIFISGFYHLGVEAQLEAKQYLEGPKVLAAIEKLANSPAPPAPSDSEMAEFEDLAELAEFELAAHKWLTNLANATRMRRLIDELLGPSRGMRSLQVVFAHDWQISRQPFRTTWTSGWWLESLSQQLMPEANPFRDTGGTARGTREVGLLAC